MFQTSSQQGGLFGNNQMNSQNFNQQNGNQQFGNDDSLKDCNINQNQHQPFDTVQSLEFCGNHPNTFSAACWDGKIKVYQLQDSFIDYKTEFMMDFPVLSSSWRYDGNKIYAGVDNQIKEIDVQTSSTRVIGNHDSGISGIFYNKHGDNLISVSFDKTIKIWQGLNQQQPNSQTINLGLKIFNADFEYPNLILGLQSEKILLQNINSLISNPNQLNNIVDCPLGKGSQIQSISLAPQNQNQQTLAIGTIDGRCNISQCQLNNLKDMKPIMTFKSHKQELNPPQFNAKGEKTYVMYPVNSVGHSIKNPQFLYSAGADGYINFWDYQKKTKAGSLTFAKKQVSCAQVDVTGSILVYALGYDWHQGPNPPVQYSPKICAHKLANNDLHAS